MSVACLSLAVKMEETVAPLPVDLQVKEKLQHCKIDNHLMIPR